MMFGHLIAASCSFTANNPTFTGSVVIEAGLGSSAISLESAGGLGRAQFYDSTGGLGGQIGALSGESLGITTDNTMTLSANDITFNAAQHGFFSQTPVSRPSVPTANATALHQALLDLGLIST